MIIQFEGLTREEAYTRIIALRHSKKGELVHVDTLDDGRRIYLSMSGKKSPFDFTIHVDSERGWVRYGIDFLSDILEKQEASPSVVLPLVEALEESVKWHAIKEIYKKHPELKPDNTCHLPGHTIDYLVRVIRWLGLQEDVNYWGPRFDGRMKPIIALRDLLINRMSLDDVKRVHKIAA